MFFAQTFMCFLFFCFFQWNIYQFGDPFWHGASFTPPQLMEYVTVMLTTVIFSSGYVGSSESFVFFVKTFCPP